MRQSESVFAVHNSRLDLLSRLCKWFPVNVYGGSLLMNSLTGTPRPYVTQGLGPVDRGDDQKSRPSGLLPGMLGMQHVYSFVHSVCLPSRCGGVGRLISVVSASGVGIQLEGGLEAVRKQLANRLS